MLALFLFIVGRIMEMTMKIIDIEVEQIEEIILKNEKISVILFSTTWSGGSIMMEGVLEFLLDKFSETIQVYKINVGNSNYIEESDKIKCLYQPILRIYKQNELLEEIRGFVSYTELNRKIEKAIYSNSLESIELA